MAFLRAWDETDPTNANLAREGAQEIRQLKEDIRERFNVEHFVGNADTSPFGMHKWTSRLVTGDYTISSSANDHVIYADASSGNLTITLPDITDQGGRPIRIIRADDNYIVSNSPRWVKIAAANGQTIKGVSSINIYGVGRGVELIADEDSGTGLNWRGEPLRSKLDMYYHGSQSGTYSLGMEGAMFHFIEASGGDLTINISSSNAFDRAILVVKNNNYIVDLGGISTPTPTPTLTRSANTQDYIMLVKSFGTIAIVGIYLGGSTA